MRSPQSLVFSRLNNPNTLSLSSQQRGSRPQIIFVASSGPVPTGPCLSCAEGSRAGCRTLGGKIVFVGKDVFWDKRMRWDILQCR